MLSVETLPGFPAIPGLRYALSTRMGGVSEGAFATLNLGYHVGDEAARVTENRRRFAQASGYPAEALVCARQVHGTRIARVEAADMGRGALDWNGAIPATDGLLTSAVGVPVAIFTADCAPVLLADPVRHLLAVVHAGWRGAAAGIAGEAVRMMTALGSRPDDIHVGIGPALCIDCLEVGGEVVTAVQNYPPTVIKKTRGHSHLDLGALLRADLCHAGIAARRIVGPSGCTRCQPDRYFSHRGQQGHAGRQALVAWWAR